jgi:hypothetical protein
MEPSVELAIPGTGELVKLDDEVACALALDAVREYERLLREAKSALTEAIIERATVLGVRSFALPDGRRAEVSASTESVYDAQAVEDGLRAAGMPEERIAEIIEEQVSYRVRAAQAKRAAAANPAYAAVIEASRTEHSRNRYISLKRGRS